MEPIHFLGACVFRRDAERKVLEVWDNVLDLGRASVGIQGGQKTTQVVIKWTKQNLSMCAHMCLSGVAQECGLEFSSFTNLPVGETTPGEHPVPLTSPGLGQERIWDTSLKTANVTASRLRLANSLLFPALSTDSLALFSSLCHGETQIKPFGEGGLGAKAFTPPRAPFCHPSCFAQQQLHSAPAAPGHGLPDLTLGGSIRFSWRLEAGCLWGHGDADAARLERYRRWSIICSFYQKPGQ